MNTEVNRPDDPEDKRVRAEAPGLPPVAKPKVRVKTMTEAALAANRQNAQKSTGPKNTDMTKYNATYHGTRGSRAVLPGEDNDEYLGLAHTLERRWQPADTLEHQWVKRMADRQWELERLQRMKGNTLVQDPYRDTMLSEYLRLINAEEKVERALVRCRKELTQLQRLRGKDMTWSPAPGDELPLPPVAPGEHPTTWICETYDGPHGMYRPSQGEVALDHLLARARRELHQREGRWGRSGLRDTIEHWADVQLSQAPEAEADDLPEYLPGPESIHSVVWDPDTDPPPEPRH